MSRRNPDAIDMVCNDWAREKRKYLGIILPEHLEYGKIVGGLSPRERIGKLRCTLAAVKDGDFGAYGTFNQSFPEVFKGDALVVNQYWHALPSGTPKHLMLVHYVWREIQVTDIAEELKLDVPRYYEIYNDVKRSLDKHLKAIQQPVAV